MGMSPPQEQTRSSLIYNPEALPATVGGRLRSGYLERSS